MQRVRDGIRLLEIPGILPPLRMYASTSLPSSGDAQDDMIRESREFRQLSLSPVKKERKRLEDRKWAAQDVMPPRAQRMHIDQTWPDVWPAAATFKPATVPLPVHMTHNPEGIPLNKFGNAELMKIPNFFHLTPLAIKTHCAALKKFCTSWPKELDTDEKCQTYFPMETITSDYCHSGHSIVNTRARIVSLRVKFAALNMDFHARDKFLRLIGDRYDPSTGYVTFITERCPTRKQNTDYAKYLLTALYFESWKTEAWEKEKSLEDHEAFYWEQQPSKQIVAALVQKVDGEKDSSATPSDRTSREVPPGSAEIRDDSKLRTYKDAVENLMNNGENLHSLEKYRIAVEKLYGLG